MTDFSNMTDREIDAAVAEKVMNECAHRRTKRYVIEDGNSCDEGIMCIDCKADATCPRYSTDRNAAADVIRRVGELGLWRTFIWRLSDIVYAAMGRIRYPNDCETEVDRVYFQMWALLVNGSPRQICIAALTAKEGEK